MVEFPFCVIRTLTMYRTNRDDVVLISVFDHGLFGSVRGLKNKRKVNISCLFHFIKLIEQ